MAKAGRLDTRTQCDFCGNRMHIGDSMHVHSNGNTYHSRCWATMKRLVKQAASR